jgi:hypothetical protein
MLFTVNQNLRSIKVFQFRKSNLIAYLSRKQAPEALYSTTFSDKRMKALALEALIRSIYKSFLIAKRVTREKKGIETKTGVNLRKVTLIWEAIKSSLNVKLLEMKLALKKEFLDIKKTYGESVKT